MGKHATKHKPVYENFCVHRSCMMSKEIIPPRSVPMQQAKPFLDLQARTPC